MILNYGLNDRDVKDYFEVICDEKVTDLGDKQCESGKLFSAKPYVLLIDYDKIFNLSALKKYLTVELSGSKIIYCLFFGRSYKKGYAALAAAMAKDKGMVLYGHDFLYLNEQGKLQDTDNFKLKGTADYIRDFRPFNNNLSDSPFAKGTVLLPMKKRASV